MSAAADPGIIMELWNMAAGFLTPELLIAAIGLQLVIALITVNAIGLIYVELKTAAHITFRPGPMEVGWHGILQSVMDPIKLLAKEVVTPTAVNKPLFIMAPVVVIIPVLVAFIVIPFSEKLIIRDLNLGLLLIFSFSTLNVLGILMGGWASNNKFSLLGAIRAVAQNIAYEIPILISIMSVLVIANSLKMTDIVNAQIDRHIWFIFCAPIAAITYFIASVAETNRLPFDIPEAEGELVSGFHTEYSGMRFAMFFLAEYTNMFLVAAVFTTLFLGGWQGPLLPGPIWFLLKVYFLVFIVIVARWTFPRMRFDQLMTFAWKVLIPFSLFSLILTAFLVKLIR